MRDDAHAEPLKTKAIARRSRLYGSVVAGCANLWRALSERPQTRRPQSDLFGPM